MRRTLLRTLTVGVVLVVLLAWAVLGASAAHEGVNHLTFAPAAATPAPAGTGTLAFQGGDEPRSRWTSTFRFTGLQVGATYSVVVQGRFGDDGTPAATAFSGLCSFRTDGSGAGGCWNYSLGLRRLAVAQLRLGDEAGPSVLQATRAIGGPGAIASAPNRFTPSR